MTRDDHLQPEAWAADKAYFSETGLSITQVTRDEMPEFIKLLREYGDLPGRGPTHNSALVNTAENLSHALLDRRVEAVIARVEGEPAGFACWSEAYHIMSGRSTMEVKHLYVRAGHRRQPLAVTLLLYMLHVADQRDYWRVEGMVGGWNKSVQMLYQVLKADRLDQIRYRLQDPGRFLNR